MLLKQTKIVATISDKRCDVDFIKGLFEAGMNVVRMNTAHLGREGSEMLINNVRAVSNRIAILMDTKGPEVRTTICADPIAYKVGDRVKVVGDPDLETTRECISVSYPNFVHDVAIGIHILIDDGDLEMIVVDKTEDYLVCEIQNEAIQSEGTATGILRREGATKDDVITYLAEKIPVETLRGTANDKLIYKKDWNLGDYVTVEFEDMTTTKQITEVQEVHEPNRNMVIPVFGSEKENIIKKIMRG